MCSVSKTKTHLCHTQLQSVVSYSCFVTYNARHAMYNNQFATCCVLPTCILALFQILTCYQQRLHEEGSLDPTLSEHLRNNASFHFSTYASFHFSTFSCYHLFHLYEYTSKLYISIVRFHAINVSNGFEQCHHDDDDTLCSEP